MVSFPVSAAEQSSCLAEARQEACKGFPQDGLGGLLFEQGNENSFTATARPLVKAIVAAINSRQWTQLTEPVHYLAGLGPGLTPAGDDFIGGLLAALSFHHASCGFGPPPEFLADLAGEAGTRTSLFSAQMLGGAAQGLVSKETAAWLAAVHHGEMPVIPQATRNIINYGHTSGIDMLCGLITTLESLLEQHNDN
jgi:hypothetical protein